MWKFNPILKTKIWGGSRIGRLHGIDHDGPLGESWLLSGVPGSISTVASGPDSGLSLSLLIDRHKDALLGRLNYIRYGHEFPLLIKLIDAAGALSVQVHPDDDLAREIGSPHGKTEMWYVLDADAGAALSLGFNRDIDPTEFNSLCGSGEIEKCLNNHCVHTGDVFFIPPGTVHAIGAGCFIAEVQQSSDDTFRIYDYGRLGDDGQPRPLHTDLAARALRFNATDGRPLPYTANPDVPVNLVRSPFFTTNVMTLDEPTLRDYSECDSFVCLLATRGNALIEAKDQQPMTLYEGEIILIPASTDNVRITPGKTFTALEIYIKQ